MVEEALLEQPEGEEEGIPQLSKELELKFSETLTRFSEQMKDFR